MKLCNPCAAALTVEHHGKADLTRTGGHSARGECQRCGRKYRPVIEYEIIPRPAENQTKE